MGSPVTQEQEDSTGRIISKKALNEEMKYISLGEEAYWSVRKTSPILLPFMHTHAP